MDKFYVTTPIYYVNDVPHIGHAYTTIAADVIARHWKNKIGKDNVFFLTGTDEHGAKVAQAAKEAGKTPIEFADSVSKRFEDAWKLLEIDNSYFIRTTNPSHEKIVQDILQKIYEKGFIYEGVYEGFYCEGCEKFLTKEELVDGKCPLHPNKNPVFQKEKNYFFKLSSFQKNLIKLFETNTVEILPQTRKNEILGKLKENLQDISISREGVEWGIPLPWDKKQTIYVWVDALFNYYTATQFLNDKNQFWPTDLHIVGKDILWFHTVIWCSLLMAAGLELPKKVLAHGFFTINGQKMSKSLKNVISPKELVDKFGKDATRYLLLSEFPFGQDGDFSFDKLKTRYNSELANNLGNLVARVSKLCEKSDFNLENIEKTKSGIDPQIEKTLESFEFDEATRRIQEHINTSNAIIDQLKPWSLKDKELEEALHKILSHISFVGYLVPNLEPFMPETTQKIKDIFNGPKIKTAPPLFPRLS